MRMKKREKKINGSKLFDIFNYCLMTVILLCTLYPFYYTLIASISNGSEVIRGKVIFWPVGVTLEAYKRIPSIAKFLSVLRKYYFLYSIWGGDQHYCNEYGGICSFPNSAEGAESIWFPDFPDALV